MPVMAIKALSDLSWLIFWDHVQRQLFEDTPDPMNICERTYTSLIHLNSKRRLLVKIPSNSRIVA